MAEITFIIGFVASLITVIAAGASAIRYLGRSEVVTRIARALGVDLYELSGGLDEALEREPPMKVMESLENYARAGEKYTPDMLVTAAGNVASPSVLIENALLGEELVRTELLGNHLSDDELEELVTKRDVWPDPIDRVVRLDDDASIAYAWVLEEGVTEKDKASLASEIEQTFIEEKAAEPEALHFIVSSISELKELDEETLENYVKPWLKERENEGGNR